MSNLSWQKVRSSILWILAIAAVLAYASFARAVETAENYNNLSLVRAGDLIGFSLVAALFAVLSLVLKGNDARSVNLVGGVVMAVIALLSLVDGITVHFAGAYNLVLALAVILLASIVWFAYRTPKIQTPK